MDLDLAGMPGWYADAACLGVPARLGRDPWFPEGNGSNPAEAAAICTGCPVRERCADYALEHRVREGVWGGLTPTERTAPARRAG